MKLFLASDDDDGIEQGQEKMLQSWGGMRDEPHWLTTAAIGELVGKNSIPTRIHTRSRKHTHTYTNIHKHTLPTFAACLADAPQ